MKLPLLFAFLVLLQVFDAWTTHQLLKYGGKEVNPFVPMAEWFERFGTDRMLLVTKLGIVLAAAYFTFAEPKLNTTAYIFMDLIYCYVVVHNYQQLRLQKYYFKGWQEKGLA